ncbi:hypothetical protein QG516_25805 [Pedobacter gandavensis]|uniref:hypothetical protein n=1 Tax=Pedobacter gandavensis TaxID=2679963 RepID=UPI0024792EC6|nr:hypothetical protein [Pedobacter gandavensis]WGQ09932.1 hypothetical protein QG516_25805 [Pedobacter gandavensis]
MTVGELRKFMDHIKDEHDGETFDLMLPFKESQKFLMYSTSISDMKSCLEYCDEFLKSPTPVVKTALLKALIITYARCFTRSDQLGGKVEPVELFAESDNKELFIMLHSLMMETRNKYVAHRELNGYERYFPFLSINVRSGDFSVKVYSENDNHQSDIWIKAYKVIIIHALKTLELKRDKNAQRLFSYFLSDHFEKNTSTFTTINSPTIPYNLDEIFEFIAKDLPD